MLTLLFFSCENEASVTEGTALSNNVTPVLNFPERVPADAHLNTLMMSGETDWGVYDEYYKNEVLTQSSEAFFINLQWSTIAFLVKNTDLLENSTPSDHSYYLSEILNRDYVNKPDIVVSLLEKQRANGMKQSQVASIARSVLAKNENYLSKENFKKHKERNSEAFKQLFDFGYDRWGKEK